MKNRIKNWFFHHAITIISCVLITTLGIAFLVFSSPQTTIIGEDITTGKITATEASRNIGEVGASYIIYTDGTTTYAKNGSTGKIDYSGTDTASVIQSAIDALTAGRTWKEKIMLVGNFTLSGEIDIPSYTVLEIQGKIKQTNSNYDVIRIAGTNTSHRTNIEIFGGIIEGSGNTGTKKSGIYATYTFDSSFHDLDISNNSYPCMYFQYSDRNVIYNVYAHDSWECGIEFSYDSDENLVFGCKVINMFDGPEGYEQGYVVELNSDRNLFINCYAENCSNGFGMRSGSYNVISGCIEKDSRGDGYNFGTGATHNILANSISEGTLGSYGIVSYGNYNQIIGCKVENPSVHAFGVGGQNCSFIDCNAYDENYIGYGFHSTNDGNRFLFCRAEGFEHGFVIEGCDKNKLFSCESYDCSNSGINLYSNPTNCLVDSCSAEGSTYNFKISGSGHTLRDNIGYITENSGTAILPAGSNSTTTSHGLAGTPTIITANAASSTVGAVSIISKDSTSFTITTEATTTAPVEIYWYAKM